MLAGEQPVPKVVDGRHMDRSHQGSRAGSERLEKSKGKPGEPGGLRGHGMFYFAYASNLNRKQMAERCPDSQPKFKATLPNHKLIFAGWSRTWHGATASIKPFQGNKVARGVYEISERDLASLDKYESCPTVYSRVKKRVITEDGDPVEVVTYIMQQQSEETQPSREYLAIIQQGYRDWGII